MTSLRTMTLTGRCEWLPGSGKGSGLARPDRDVWMPAVLPCQCQSRSAFPAPGSDSVAFHWHCYLLQASRTAVQCQVNLNLELEAFKLWLSRHHHVDSLLMPFSMQLAWTVRSPPPPGQVFLRRLAASLDSLLLALACCIFQVDSVHSEQCQWYCTSRDTGIPEAANLRQTRLRSP